jgi:hypothetical protein
MSSERRTPDGRAPDAVTEGGDPVCWLERVCDECGAMREDPAAPACARCGTPFPAPEQAPGTGPDAAGA